ncbi:MAG: hypothetical protein AAGF78_02830 [Pseudomonadota bacterium]
MHHRIADTLRSQITDRANQMGLTQQQAQDLAQALQKPENLAFYFLGCQGPDPFFFNTKDVSPAVAQFVGVYLDFITAIEEIKEVIRTAFHPAIEAVNAAIDASSTLQQIRAAYEDVKQVIDAIMPLVTSAITRFILEFNVFDLLDHPYRDGASPGEWWWFDAMHYRRTGAIASELLSADRDVTSPTHLYALGYLTHVGADTVGHAYVNLWSGGPYRSQSQRHKTGENFQDVAYFDPGAFNPNAPFETSRLHWLYNFNYDGTENEEDPDDDGPAALTQLPDDLAKTIAESLNKVYDRDSDGTPDFASRISEGDIKDAYRLYYAFLKSSTETIPAPEPYSFSEELEEVWGRATDRLGDIADFVTDSGSFGSGSSGLIGFLNMLARAILGALAAAAALVDAVLATIATFSLAGLRAVSALVYEQLYNAWEMLREGVALGGLGFPLERHLGNPIFAQFLKPDIDDPTGNSAVDVVGEEPLLRFHVGFFEDPIAKIFNKERHLVYPLTDGEKRSTGVAPPSYLTETPVHYAQGRIPLELTLLDDLSTQNSLTEDDIAQIMSKGTLGNALDLSAALYGRWNGGGTLPDFNLDADRGYGYTCWVQTGDITDAPQPLKTNSDAGDPSEVSLETIKTGGA